MNTSLRRRRCRAASSPIHLATTAATWLPLCVWAYLGHLTRECRRPQLMLVDGVAGCRQHLERPQPLSLRLAVHAGEDRRHPGRCPQPEPFANIGGRPGNADGVDEGVGHPVDRLQLFAAEVELLEHARIVGEAVLADEVVVEVLCSRT